MSDWRRQFETHKIIERINRHVQCSRSPRRRVNTRNRGVNSLYFRWLQRLSENRLFNNSNIDILAAVANEEYIRSGRCFSEEQIYERDIYKRNGFTDWWRSCYFSRYSSIYARTCTNFAARPWRSKRNGWNYGVRTVGWLQKFECEATVQVASQKRTVSYFYERKSCQKVRTSGDINVRLLSKGRQAKYGRAQFNTGSDQVIRKRIYSKVRI